MKDEVIKNFEKCVVAGNLVMERYPKQCNTDGSIFIADVALTENQEKELQIQATVLMLVH